GGTKTPQSLRVIGLADAHPFGGQHDARVLSDGTITVHDNGTFLHRRPRALRFAIDESSRTARLIDRLDSRWAGDSSWGGSARLVPGGDWVVSWGGTRWIAEMSHTGRPLFTLKLAKKYASYRAIPILKGELTASALRADMDAMATRARRAKSSRKG